MTALATPETPAALLEVRGLFVDTPEGRPLFRDLHLCLGHERVAVLGRNGVGKSTLLELLAGAARPERGTVITRTRPRLVRQDPSPAEAAAIARRWLRRSNTDRAFASALADASAPLGLPSPIMLADPARLSRGQARKLHLLEARLRRPQLLLLDEPTEDLDDEGARWLCDWLPTWPGGLVVVSHDRRVLGCFEHFFVIAESGCRYVPGSFEALEQQLEQEQADRQRRYVARLNTLAQQEQHHDTVCRRRRRKKNVGRLHELRRCTSRSRLNEKASYAQQSQARAAKIREDRIDSARAWAKATRRALSVNLPLEVPVPALGPCEGEDLVTLGEVGVVASGRRLFEGLTLRLGRDRLAIVGPNGAGKTTLLRVILGERTPTTGTAARDAARIGSIAQGATDWMSDESLVSHLADRMERPSLEAVAQRLLAHKFPLALAQRPLRSLSPGERVRAALLCLLQRAPTMELLVLDEPTDSLDFVGTAALQRVLRAWPGGLVVASHDREFLAAIGIDQALVLDGRGEHHLAPGPWAQSDQ